MQQTDDRATFWHPREKRVRRRVVVNHNHHHHLADSLFLLYSGKQSNIGLMTQWTTFCAGRHLPSPRARSPDLASEMEDIQSVQGHLTHLTYSYTITEVHKQFPQY